MHRMTHAVRIHSYGGPEVLRWETVEVPEPGPGQARVRHTAIGLNFIDTYERTGLYPLQLPAVLGREAAGVVEAVGPGVSQVKAGDRIAYAFNSSGAYSEARVLPADRLVRIPEGVDDTQAAALMLKGMTAQMLLRQTYRVRKGQHAARACCGRRRRLDSRAVGEASRRDGDRGGRLASQSGAGARARC